MDTLSFLKKILPTEGPQQFYCAALFINGLHNPPRHIYLPTIEQLVDVVQKIDAKGANVFHACMSYATAESRKQSNTLFAKSFWLDLDVGADDPKKYPTIQEAAADILRAAQALGLPAPLMVKSGRGLHCYWPLTENAHTTDWKPLADRFGLCLDHLGVKHDSTRTADQASILRPVGAHHRKADPIQVKLLRDAAPIDFDQFHDAVAAYADEHNLFVRVASSSAPKSALSSGMDEVYPPSSGAKAAEHCPAMAEVRDTQGDVPYMQWRCTIGVLKHCTDGEQLAEQWSELREQTGHDKVDWQQQLNGWNAGPTLCQEMSKHTEACKTCPNFGKIKSPIQRGVTDVAPSAPVVLEVEVSPGLKQEVAWEPNFPPHYRWSGNTMQRYTKVVDPDTGTASDQWVAFCTMLLQAGHRLEELDKTMQLELEFHTYYNGKPKVARLPTSTMTDPKALKKFLGSYECFLIGKDGFTHMDQYLRDELARARAKRTHIAVRPHLGWQTVDNRPGGMLTNEFVFGGKILRPKETPARAYLSDTVNSMVRDAQVDEGDLESWIRAVNFVYNRPGAMPWQFAFAVAFGAPLVRLIGGMWHGAPYVMYGDTGVAKSSTAKAALTIYGNPDNYTSSQIAKGGDTMNATMAKLSQFHNLPMLFDELSGREAEDIVTLLYAVTNGKGRDRSTVNGALVERTAHWDTLTLITTNSDLRDKLREIKDDRIQGAIKQRLVQVTLPSEREFKRVFYDVNPAHVEGAILEAPAGMAGEKYLQFLVNNQEKIVGVLRQARASYKIDETQDPAERMHRDLVFTAMMGARFAKQLGLIHFDLEALEAWAKEVIVAQRADIHDWDDNITRFLGSLRGRILKTRTFLTKRQMALSGRKAELPLEQPFGTTEIAARMAVDDQTLWVDYKYLASWCEDRGVPVKKMLQEMHLRRTIIPVQESPRLTLCAHRYLTAGTNIPGDKYWAFQVDYSKMDLGEGGYQHNQLEDAQPEEGAAVH